MMAKRHYTYISVGLKTAVEHHPPPKLPCPMRSGVGGKRTLIAHIACTHQRKKCRNVLRGAIYGPSRARNP